MKKSVIIDSLLLVAVVVGLGWFLYSAVESYVNLPTVIFDGKGNPVAIESPDGTKPVLAGDKLPEKYERENR